VGRVNGAKDKSYTSGVICANVARSAERVHHSDRLLHPCAASVRKEGGGSKRSLGMLRSTSRQKQSRAQQNAMAELPSGSNDSDGTMALIQCFGMEEVRMCSSIREPQPIAQSRTKTWFA